MGAGTKRIPEDRLWDDYFTNLHQAHNAMLGALKLRADGGLTQDDIAEKLGVDKGLVSKRINGKENHTFKTLSFMGTAMDCRVVLVFEPYENIGGRNFFNPTASADSANKIVELKPREPETVNG